VLLVKTLVRPSAIHGLGLFANQLIRRGGSNVLRYVCLPQPVNHARDTANVGPSEARDEGEPLDVALRDIQLGEELTFDYRHFGEDPT
jgi:hypothetical protein